MFHRHVDVPSYSECYKCMSLQMRELSRELGVLMERLWEDPAVQLAYSRSVDYRGVQLTYSKIIQYWVVPGL